MGFSEMTFSLAGPFIWNSLPKYVDSATTKHRFSVV